MACATCAAVTRSAPSRDAVNTDRPSKAFNTRGAPSACRVMASTASSVNMSGRWSDCAVRARRKAAASSGRRGVRRTGRTPGRRAAKPGSAANTKCRSSREASASNAPASMRSASSTSTVVPGAGSTSWSPRGSSTTSRPPARRMRSNSCSSMVLPVPGEPSRGNTPGEPCRACNSASRAAVQAGWETIWTEARGSGRTSRGVLVLGVKLYTTPSKVPCLS